MCSQTDPDTTAHWPGKSGRSALGPSVSGWLIGLSPTSTPVCFFLALELGTTYASKGVLASSLWAVTGCILLKKLWNRLGGVWVLKDAVLDWEKIRSSGFQVLPHRWIVERTFTQRSTWRRLFRDYEALPSSEEAWMYAAMIHIMLRRFAQKAPVAFAHSLFRAYPTLCPPRNPSTAALNCSD